MIDGVSFTGENLVINKVGGSVPSPPPSSTQTRQTETNRTPGNAKQLGQTSKNEVEKSARDSDLEKQMQDSIQALNEKLGRLDREVLFKVDKRNNRNYISVIDKNSKEIIREFPPEEIRNFIVRFDDFNQQLDMSADVKSLIINLEV